MGNFKVSVVTAVLNDEDTIEKTIKSVLEQTYNNIEYIVIDGCSKDGTVEIIEKYKKSIDYFVSESDAGIYDAMNKGIKVCHGDIVYFLNADDIFVDKKVVEDIVEAFLSNQQADYIYGGVLYKDPYNIKNMNILIMEEVNNEDFPKGKIIRHQALFVKRTVFEEIGGFSTNFKIVSDLEFEYKMLKNQKKGLFVKRVIARMSSGGVSSNLKACLKEREKLMEEYFGKIVSYKYAFYRKIKNAMLEFLTKTGLMKWALCFREEIGVKSTLH